MGTRHFILLLSFLEWGYFFKVNGTSFIAAYHIISNVACTTYQWDINDGGIVGLYSDKGTICIKTVFGTSIGAAYDGRLNCTIHSTPDSIGITVTFCFFNITSNDSGVYRVITPRNQRNGTVFVMDKPTKPQILPSRPTVETGSPEIMTCTSTSTSTPSPTGQVMFYTWTVNNGTLSDPRFTASGNTLTINPVEKEDKDNMLQCTARENQGLSSETVGNSLIVLYPPQGKPVISYSTLTYITGSSVMLSCSVTEDGNPKATWTWRCGNRIFNSGITNSVGRSNLTFLVTKAENNQQCTCTAFSSVESYNQTSDPVTLNIRYSPQGKPVMSFRTMTYFTGNTVVLSCSITDDGNPRATWTWKCGSRTFNSGVITSVRQSNLTMVVTKTDNNQPCTCAASSAIGSYSQTSDPAILDIRYLPQGKPVMSYNTLTHLLGSNIVLSCSILDDGNPQARWTWKCGNRTFDSGITNSVGQSNLTFVATMAENNQPCTCTASLPLGPYSQTSDPAVLDIRCSFQSPLESQSCNSAMIGMYFAGMLSSAIVAGIIHLVLFLKRNDWMLSASRKGTNETYDAIQRPSHDTNTYDDLSTKTKKVPRKETNDMYDAVQGASSDTNTYDDLSVNTKQDSNVYMNTAFGI